MKTVYARAICLALIVVVAGCGGGGGGGGTSTYSIGGTLSGLASSQSVVLQDNGGNNLTVSANGSFMFTTQVSGAYAVTVLTEPAGQTCSVTSGGSGTATANVTSVAVACTNVYSIAALVSGLASGRSVVLQNSGSNNLTVAANGTDAFTTTLANAAAYDVTVLTQPTGQTCTPQSGMGTINAANVTVDVVCVYTSGDSALDGPYTGASYTVLLSPPDYFVGSEGTATDNGMGGVTLSNSSLNVNGTVSSPASSMSTYALQNGQLVPSGVINGGVEGANENIVVSGAVVTAATSPAIGVSVKQGSGMSLTGLLGGASSATFFAAHFQATATDSIVYGATLTINSDGSGSLGGYENDNGTITVASPTPYNAGSFTVSSTGGFTFGGSTDLGGVSPDYDLSFASDQTPGDYPDIRVAVRSGSGESLATVNGQYTVVAYQDGNGDGVHGDVQVVTILADGQGHFTSSGTENSVGTISSETGSGTYTVAGNGAMTLVNSDGTTLNGGVSADGNAIVLSQITNSLTPQIIVGVRQ